MPGPQGHPAPLSFFSVGPVNRCSSLMITLVPAMSLVHLAAVVPEDPPAWVPDPPIQALRATGPPTHFFSANYIHSSQCLAFAYCSSPFSITDKAH